MIPCSSTTAQGGSNIDDTILLLDFTEYSSLHLSALIDGGLARETLATDLLGHFLHLVCHVTAVVKVRWAQHVDG